MRVSSQGSSWEFSGVSSEGGDRSAGAQTLTLCSHHTAYPVSISPGLQSLLQLLLSSLPSKLLFTLQNPTLSITAHLIAWICCLLSLDHTLPKGKDYILLAQFFEPVPVSGIDSLRMECFVFVPFCLLIVLTCCLWLHPTEALRWGLHSGTLGLWSWLPCHAEL